MEPNGRGQLYKFERIGSYNQNTFLDENTILHYKYFNGYFSKERLNGKVQEYEDSNQKLIFDGIYCNNAKHGIGTLIDYKNKIIYTGIFNINRKHGQFD